MFFYSISICFFPSDFCFLIRSIYLLFIYFPPPNPCSAHIMINRTCFFPTITIPKCHKYSTIKKNVRDFVIVRILNFAYLSVKDLNRPRLHQNPKSNINFKLHIFTKFLANISPINFSLTAKIQHGYIPQILTFPNFSSHTFNLLKFLQNSCEWTTKQFRTIYSHL